MALAVLAATVGSAPASAQSRDDEESVARVWTIDQLYQSFCVQFLIDPASLATRLPQGLQPLPASAADDLHPSLKGVIESQPEFASWAPSRFCMLYFGQFEAGGRVLRQANTRKAPVLGIWTVAAGGPGPQARRDVALELYTNNSGIEAQARMAELEIRDARATRTPAPEDEDGRPSPNDRYTLRLGKSQITWEGRAAGDTVPPSSPASLQFTAQGRRGGWVNGAMSLAPRMTGGMIGVLRVQGKGDLATLMLESPTRFVGPGYLGGGASLRFEH